MSLKLGAHVDQEDPLAEAAERGAELVQFFIGNPQDYKAPKLAYADGAEALRDRAAAAGVDLYVHAPYRLNVANTNNRIRIPSRKLLQQTLDKAAEIAVKGVIVHGGHVGDEDDPEAGFDNWRKCIERAELPVPLLIENTAGGENAMARQLDRIARLWDAVQSSGNDRLENVGFCLDTCHFHAAGEDLPTVVERVMAITGRIDLVHANGSRDEFGSGADRHSNFEEGHIDPAEIVAVVQAAGAPVVVETPDANHGQKADIDYLRAHLK
ncbi:deoxyribonuclease IV [Kribbella sp. NPDC055071]